jgi:hypothetical protein
MSGDRKRHVPKEDEMNILYTALGSDSAAEICFGLIVFLFLYLAGFILFQRWSPSISGRMPLFHRHLIPGLGAALAAAGVGFWLHSADVTTAAAEGQAPASISPQELHHAVKMKPLPVQTVDDHSLVFPGRE